MQSPLASASELRADRSGMTTAERPSATLQNCIVLPVSAIIILLHRFIIVRHLDLQRKTTANESKTIPPSQPPVLSLSPTLFPLFRHWTTMIASCRNGTTLHLLHSFLSTVLIATDQRERIWPCLRARTTQCQWRCLQRVHQ